MKPKSKRSRVLPASVSPELETEITSNIDFIIGVDEVGRGCLVGNTVIAAVTLKNRVALADKIRGIIDSKKLTELGREAVYDQLSTDPLVLYALAERTPHQIDTTNILAAVMCAMAEAVIALAKRIAKEYAMPTTEEEPIRMAVLVDGNRIPPKLKDLLNKTIEWDSKFVKFAIIKAEIKGDDRFISIAAASILAKVTRDRQMIKLGSLHPAYGFAQHKGYHCPKHCKSIMELGPLKEHRLTFMPISKLILDTGVWPEGREKFDLRTKLRKKRFLAL